jgi:hypothetical protein
MEGAYLRTRWDASEDRNLSEIQWMVVTIVIGVRSSSRAVMVGREAKHPTRLPLLLRQTHARR